LWIGGGGGGRGGKEGGGRESSCETIAVGVRQHVAILSYIYNNIVEKRLLCLLIHRARS
jgi:hypothetical protein